MSKKSEAKAFDSTPIPQAQGGAILYAVLTHEYLSGVIDQINQENTIASVPDQLEIVGTPFESRGVWAIMVKRGGAKVIVMDPGAESPESAAEDIPLAGNSPSLSGISAELNVDTAGTGDV